jgi:hypothetical protein
MSNGTGARNMPRCFRLQLFLSLLMLHMVTWKVCRLSRAGYSAMLLHVALVMSAAPLCSCWLACSTGHGSCGSVHGGRASVSGRSFMLSFCGVSLTDMHVAHRRGVAKRCFAALDAQGDTSTAVIWWQLRPWLVRMSSQDSVSSGWSRALRQESTSQAIVCCALALFHMSCGFSAQAH